MGRTADHEPVPAAAAVASSDPAQGASAPGAAGEVSLTIGQAQEKAIHRDMFQAVHLLTYTRVNMNIFRAELWIQLKPSWASAEPGLRLRPSVGHKLLLTDVPLPNGQAVRTALEPCT